MSGRGTPSRSSPPCFIPPRSAAERACNNLESRVWLETGDRGGRPALTPHRCRTRREQPECLSVFLSERWLKSRPESGLVCLMCAVFARHVWARNCLALLPSRAKVLQPPCLSGKSPSVEPFSLGKRLRALRLLSVGGASCLPPTESERARARDRTRASESNPTPLMQEDEEQAPPSLEVTPNLKPQILNPKPQTPHPKPQTPNHKPQTPNPKPQTPNPKPQTPNPKPQTLDPKT